MGNEAGKETRRGERALINRLSSASTITSANWNGVESALKNEPPQIFHDNLAAECEIFGFRYSFRFSSRWRLRKSCLSPLLGRGREKWEVDRFSAWPVELVNINVFLMKTPTENPTVLTHNSERSWETAQHWWHNGEKVVFFPCDYFVLKGTSGPKEDVRGLKKDCECLSWIGGHILKVLTLSLHHVCPPFPGLCYFQSADNELESGKGFFSAGLQWEMKRDYYRMKLNDRVWAVYEEEKQEVQQE